MDESDICAIVGRIFEIHENTIVLNNFLIKNTIIYSLGQNLKIRPTIAQILLPSNALPELNKIGHVLLYKTSPPVEKVGV